MDVIDAASVVVRERFFSRIEYTESCWNWKGGDNGQGYRRISVNGEIAYAHRLAWTIFRGDIPNGLCVCHHCDNPSCVRPDHLFLGTKADNNIDRIIKGRSVYPKKKEFCVHGHPRSGDNLYIKPNGKRECRTCKRLTRKDCPQIRAHTLAEWDKNEPRPRAMTAEEGAAFKVFKARVFRKRAGA